MSSILWILAALLIAVAGCLVNIVILIRRVNRLKSMVLRQINQEIRLEIRLGEIRSRANHFASKENDEMDDVTILLSGMKAHCFGRKAGSNKKFTKSLHRINERVRDLNETKN